VIIEELQCADRLKSAALAGHLAQQLPFSQTEKSLAESPSPGLFGVILRDGPSRSCATLTLNVIQLSSYSGLCALRCEGIVISGLARHTVGPDGPVAQDEKPGSTSRSPRAPDRLGEEMKKRGT
jgi:hypothetical protein